MKQMKFFIISWYVNALYQISYSENPDGDHGGVAAGDEAQSVLEFTRTRNNFLDELLEVSCFYLSISFLTFLIQNRSVDCHRPFLDVGNFNKFIIGRSDDLII